MIDNTLPTLAQTLKNVDGKLDILARRSVLDDLVDNELSHCEIRYVRDRLNAIPLNYDIFMHLPNELLLCIVPFLGLDDFLTARMVSRAWNQRFSSPDICISIIKLHFRSTWEEVYNSAAHETQELAKYTLCKWLPSAAVKRVRRKYGTYRTLSRRSYKGCERQAISFSMLSREALYNNGRIAFRLDSYTICVQSLVAENSARFFLDADREPIGEWFLSDQFLITQRSSNKLALAAWDFELSPAGNVRLPNSIRHMSAYHDNVGLITHAKEALVWHVGGALKLFDTREVQEMVAEFDHTEMYGVLFHPIYEDLTYVVHLAWTDARPDGDNHTYTVILIVQEFKKERLRDIHLIETKYTVEPEHTPLRDWSPHIDSAFNSSQTITGEQPDKSLFCEIYSFNFKVQIIVNPDGLCGIWRALNFLERSGIPFTQLSFVTFDMYTKEFDTAYPQPEIPQGMAATINTIHGQAIDMHFKRMRKRPDKDSIGHPDGNFIYNSAEGDDNFTVLFGDNNYVVAIP